LNQSRSLFISVIVTLGQFLNNQDKLDY